MKKRTWIGMLLMATLFISASGTITFPGFANATGTTYYVATNGNDGSSGTSLGSPFRTIQKCASVAVAGDTCYVRAGTYHETVTPANSGTTSAHIVYKPYNGESVTIDGADVVTGWTLDSGSTYKASVSVASGLLANQVFVDGDMVHEARWPNIASGTSDLLDLTKYATAGSGTTATTVCDPNLNGLASGYWNGAHINIIPGSRWFAQTGTITSSGTGSPCPSGSGFITFNNLQITGTNFDPGPSDKYYLVGVRAALDSASEWYYDGTATTLYLRTPASDNPSGHTVRMKQRNYAFNLNGRSYTEIRGFNILASTITTDSGSNHITIDGINAQYVSHYVVIGDDGITGMYSHAYDTGIILNGNHNILRNSTIAYSAGNGVVVLGSNIQVVNNRVHDTNYSSTYNSLIRVPAFRVGSTWIYQGPDLLIKGNTLYNTGRDGIEHDFYNSSIVFNDIYNVGKTTQDNGVTYTGGDPTTRTEKSVIAYNRIHDNPAYLGEGIYLDTAASQYHVHHNVIYNTYEGIRLNGGSCCSLPSASRDNFIDNNTIASSGASIAIGDVNDMNGSRIVNNIFRGAASTASGAYVDNNLPSSTNPLFVNAGSYDFNLQSGSPARDAGQVIAGTTDIYGFVGSAPDQGAYEYWLATETPGYTALPSGVPDSPEISSTTPTSNALTINWNAVSGATGYKVKYGSTSSGLYSTTADVGNVTTTTLTGLPHNTKYYYVVTAYNANGESYASFQETATTGTSGKNFQDSFENGFSKWSTGFGTPSIGTSQAYDGTNSFSVNQDSDVIYHSYSSSLNGIVTLWFYDNGNSNMAVFARVDDEVWNSGSYFRGIGVDTQVSSSHYVYRVDHAETASSIARSTGWHQFKWDYTSGTKVDMYIDNTLIASPTGVTAFSDIAAGDWWPDSVTSNVFFDNVTVYSKLAVSAATASSVFTGHNPSNAFDNNPGTRWNASNGTYPQWLKLDLGSSQAVSLTKLAFYDPTGRTYTYNVQVSKDDITYTTVVAGKNTGTSTWNEDYFSPVTARYVKINMTGVNPGGDYAAIWEAEIYTGASNLAYGKKASASSVYSTYMANLANDDDEATRWNANDISPQWWKVDLGSVQTVGSTQLNLYDPVGRYYQYKVEISTDDVTYTTVADRTSNTQHQTTLTDTFTPVSARYVRISFTGCSVVGWPAIYEAKVYSN